MSTFTRSATCSPSAFQSSEPTDVAQLPVAQAYLRASTHHATVPRIGLSRAVYPAADRQTAIAHLQDGIHHVDAGNFSPAVRASAKPAAAPAAGSGGAPK